MHEDPVVETLRSRHARLATNMDALGATCVGARGGASRDAACLMDSAVARLREIVAAIDADFTECIRSEDGDIFPRLVATVPAALNSISPLLDEHTELREMVARLSATLGEQHSEERDEQIVVQVRDLVDLFRIHMRKEESVVSRLREYILAQRATGTDGPRATKGTEQ